MKKERNEENAKVIFQPPYCSAHGCTYLASAGAQERDEQVFEFAECLNSLSDPANFSTSSSQANQWVTDTMTNKILVTGIFTASLCLFFQTPSYSGIYKWVDQDGQIHYSDQANKPGAEKFTVLNNTTTKPRPIKKTEKDGKNPEDKNREKTAEKPAEPEKPKISKKEKRRLCNEAKTDIAAITSRGRTREINAKGEYSYLSEKQRQQRLNAAKKKQAEFCR